MIPTKKQIDKEIKLLEEMKPKICQHSSFGDDNHAAMQAQIDVLRENLNEEEIDERWNPDEEYNLNDNAREALNYLNGESETKTLSGDWKSLIGVKPKRF